jgi:site-specific recombinase XerD
VPQGGEDDPREGTSPQTPRASHRGTPPSAERGSTARNLTVSELFAVFLAAVKVERSQYTYADYQRWLTEFARVHGRKKARDITRRDANQFKLHLMTATWQRGKQPRRPYEPKTINHALIALKRCWNWAIEAELLPPFNPFARCPCCTPRGGSAWPPGLSPDENGEALVLSSHRHTILTEAARNGVTGPQLQLLGGWTSLEMAQRYVHLAEQDAYQAGLRAVERLNGHRSGK